MDVVPVQPPAAPDGDLSGRGRRVVVSCTALEPGAASDTAADGPLKAIPRTKSGCYLEHRTHPESMNSSVQRREKPCFRVCTYSLVERLHFRRQMPAVVMREQHDPPIG